MHPTESAPHLVLAAANVEFHEDLHLIVWRPSGVLDETAVNKVLLELLRREAMAAQPFNRFSDLSFVESFQLTFKYVFDVALHRRLSYAGRGPIKSAFYVTHPEAVQLVKIHAFTTDHSPLNVKMFEEREAAAKWLDVPVESLMPQGWRHGTGAASDQGPIAKLTRENHVASVRI